MCMHSLQTFLNIPTASYTAAAARAADLGDSSIVYNALKCVCDYFTQASIPTLLPTQHQRQSCTPRQQQHCVLCVTLCIVCHIVYCVSHCVLCVTLCIVCHIVYCVSHCVLCHIVYCASHCVLCVTLCSVCHIVCHIV